MDSRGASRVMRVAALAAAAAVVAHGSAAADGWSGSVAVAAATQSSNGSEDSFRSQFNLDEGLWLEDLDLRFRGEEGTQKEFRIEARGFGGAQPSEALRLGYRAAGPWRFRLDYDRRESFFRLAESELGLRADDWEIERWRASFDYDGWKAARLGVDLRHTERSGDVTRPLFGLRELYPLGVSLDETMQEVAFRLETRTLPVRILFEQALATYETSSGRSAAGELNLDGDDPDLFAGARDGRSDERDVPTTRLVASYSNPRLEVLGALLWSPAELDGRGEVAEAFGIGGGAIGRVEFIDQLVRSGDQDVFAANLRLGVRLAAHWTLRLEGDHRDSASDATAVGQRIVRITGPFGDVFDLPGAIDEASFFDLTDTSGRLTLEWADRGWAVWGGVSTASREVDWRLSAEDERFDVSRDSDGALAGISFSRAGVRGSVEYEHASFDRFVFRTDPETVDRLSFRLAAELGNGWSAHAHARFEDADNPPPAAAILESGSDTASLDRAADAFGGGFAWSGDGGDSGFGLDLDQLDLTNETLLILPSGLPGLSRYDLSLLTVTAHGRAKVGRTRLSGQATRVDDAGDTWPFESWIGRARVGVEVAADVEVAVFGEYWDYDEVRAAGDDFDVTRYGLAVAWRFE